jgi:O-antigen biosynthesis protein
MNVAAQEAIILRLQAEVDELRLALRARRAELDQAAGHIARLEESLLKLKQAKRELRELKLQRRALRESPEHRIGQVLLLPYRLPQRLFRIIKRRFGLDRQPLPDPQKTDYQLWFERHRTSLAQTQAMREESRTFSHRPLISVITPVFNTPIAWLTEAIESVLAQAYENWELILVDDASTSPETVDLLGRQPARDARIRLVRLEQNGGISVASNRGVAEAQGEWIGFLDHDDLLEPDALFHTARVLQTRPDVDLIYSDEDKLTETGLDNPFFKPDWSPDFFLACNYFCHFVTIRRDLVQRIGGFYSRFDGSQDYDLLLRAVEQTDRICHIPRVLYHWRRSSNSSSTGIRRKPGQFEAGRCAVAEHLRRKGVTGHVAIDWRMHAYWVKRDLPDPKKISIIIPACDRVERLARCIDSISTRTGYPNYEIVVVGNGGEEEATLSYFRRSKHQLLICQGASSYPALYNFAVMHTESPWLLFLDNDIEAIEPDWLAYMAEHVQRSEVGAVGARLLSPDGTIEHAGVILGSNGVAQPAFSGLPAEDPGVYRQLQMMRNYSAVCGACLLTRREVFQQVGEFDARCFPDAWADVDLCLKMRRAGYLIVYTPFAKLYYHRAGGCCSRAGAKEADVIRERWARVLEYDPYYNPNLSRERADFSLGR